MAIKARYTEQIVAQVSPEVKATLARLAEERDTSMSEVVRQVIDFGLPVVEGVASDPAAV